MEIREELLTLGLFIVMIGLATWYVFGGGYETIYNSLQRPETMG